ncbi:bifunctional diguanylate cyclase/phosphodiesterase [Streptomyces sp. WAC06614]|uniref:putative bifunctional diguanylate cyclase/phosphodiesterase n=1 Tax=Streptomyces sp. WAC06614 TaxID=2487416 RepID=UPI000F7AB8F9|nr:EAL domain-containing protein [Streptomyces sp. WAC06614]RSS57753.1 EAL domain-containing protein [Streptomyces sp. WAC06614]
MAAGLPADLEDRIGRFATIWSRAIFPVTATSLTRAEFERHLLPLARTLNEALHARSFDPAVPQRVGAELVAVHCTDPEALSGTLGVVDSYLVLYCGPGGTGPEEAEQYRARCARLQHGIAAGFARALRERTLREQEAIARSALTARSDAQEALHLSEERFRAVFEGAAIGIGIADLEGNVLEVNDALLQMFGGLEGHVRGRNVSEWGHPDDAPNIWRMYGELVRGEREHYRAEKPYYRHDGTVLWTNLTVSLLRDAEGRPQYQLALMEDTTERRLLNLRLRYEATHDALTGLPNRTLFFERLEKALSAPADDGARFGLAYLDLDGFKAVNDSLGHSAGDRLLVEVADRLQSCATGPGEVVARLGGDEFVALTTGPDTEKKVTDLAVRILSTLAAPIRLDGRELTVRGSIGIVEGPAGERTPAEVLRSADITMYRAKAAGGNRFEFADAEADARAITRHGLTNALPGALERGEFFVEYQPLVDMNDGSVYGAEALVRWSHPQYGVLGPDRFIPLAERTGLIVPLGRWVLEEAVRQARNWQREHGGPLRINVNLSPTQLHHPGLVADTVAVLENSGLEPGSLCLEVTESALIGADDELLEPLRRLAALGVDIALDDFGTGYSNLANLRRLPVSVLKLDRSFTQGMQQQPADPVDVKIVEGIVALAHSLELAVTVEGVETGAQAAQLRALGCDTAQGWYYARPGAADRIHSLSLSDAAP